MAASTKHGASDARDRISAVRDYHRRTKHLPGRYAPGPGYLDWANQPNPFRRYVGARLVELPLACSYGRNAHCCAPPAQIRTWSLNHPAPTSGA